MQNDRIIVNFPGATTKMDAMKLVKEGPPQGKEHRHPEMYYEGRGLPGRAATSY